MFRQATVKLTYARHFPGFGHVGARFRMFLTRRILNFPKFLSRLTSLPSLLVSLLWCVFSVMLVLVEWGELSVIPVLVELG